MNSTSSMDIRKASCLSGNKAICACFPFLTGTRKVNTSTEQMLNHTFVMRDVQKCFVVFLIFFVVLTNFGLTIGIWKTNREITLLNKIYIIWAFFDLYSGIVTIPFFAYIYWKNKLDIICNNGLLAPAMSLENIAFGSNQGAFLLISIIRNFSIKKPLNEYRRQDMIRFICMYGVIVLGISILSLLAYSPAHNDATIWLSLIHI